MTFKLSMVLTCVLVLMLISFGCVLSQPEVERIIPNSNHTISSEELNTVQFLFEKNNMSLENLQCYKLTNYTPTQRFDLYCNQFYQDLPVLTHELEYVFNWDATPGYKTNPFKGSVIPTDQNLSIEPIISMEEAARIAKSRIDEDEFTAILAIYDSNLFGGVQDSDYELVWLLKPTDRNTSPFIIEGKFAIIDANTGKILSADDGIRY